MKILFWNDGFLPRIGGIETLTLELMNRFQQAGHHNLLVTSQDVGDAWQQRDNYAGHTVVRFPYHLALQKRNPEMINYIRDNLLNVLHDFKPDVIQLNAAYAPCCIFFLLIKPYIKVPVHLTIHGLYLQNKAAALLTLRQVIRQVNSVSCVSQAIANELNDLLPMNNIVPRIMHPTLSLPPILPTPIEHTNPILLCVGRLVKEKGFDTALHAFAQLRKNFPKIRLVIAGDGAVKDDLQNLAKDLNISDAVEFLGFIAPLDIPKLMNCATMLLMPSTYEPFGLTALQAAQLGRPVVASRVGGLTEIIQADKTGILVEPNNANSLAAAVRYLLQSPEIMATMGRQARDHVMEKFSTEKMVASYLDHYTHLTHSKNHAKQPAY